MDYTIDLNPVRFHLQSFQFILNAVMTYPLGHRARTDHFQHLSQIYPCRSLYLLDRLTSQFSASLFSKEMKELSREEISELDKLSRIRREVRKKKVVGSKSAYAIHLLDVLEAYRGYRTSNPRDKIYAALSLVSNTQPEYPIPINYERPLYLVLYDVAV